MVLVSSTRFWRLLLEVVFIPDFFHEAICAFWPEAVLKRWRDSLKEGPDSMEDSMRLSPLDLVDLLEE